MFVGRPSNPASPSSRPPLPPAKLVHGKCSLTSFPGPSTSCLLLCQVRAKEGSALQISSSLSCSMCASGPLGPFKALWVVDSTLTFTQSCLGSQDGVPGTGASRWAPSQLWALLLGRLWGKPRAGRLGWAQQHWDNGILITTQWSQWGSPYGFLGVLWVFCCLVGREQRLFLSSYGPTYGLAEVPWGVIYHPNRWKGSDGPSYGRARCPTAPLSFTPADTRQQRALTATQPHRVCSGTQGRSRRAAVNKQEGLFQPLRPAGR